MRCREILQSILSVCHRAVFNGVMREDWQRHESAFARRWRVQMASRRKIVNASAEDDVGLEQAIGEGAPSSKAATQLMKDIHLVVAALQTDRVILTLDDRARKGFEALAGTYRGLNRLRWLDPSREHDEIQTWLKGGK